MTPSTPGRELHTIMHLTDVYVPASLARQFARAEITSQELVDGSFILRGEIRIKVDLTR